MKNMWDGIKWLFLINAILGAMAAILNYLAHKSGFLIGLNIFNTIIWAFLFIQASTYKKQSEDK